MICKIKDLSLLIKLIKFFLGGGGKIELKIIKMGK
jgi:hypothetical protein